MYNLFIFFLGRWRKKMFKMGALIPIIRIPRQLMFAGVAVKGGKYSSEPGTGVNPVRD